MVIAVDKELSYNEIEYIKEHVRKKFIPSKIIRHERYSKEFVKRVTNGTYSTTIFVSRSEIDFFLNILKKSKINFTYNRRLDKLVIKKIKNIFNKPVTFNIDLLDIPVKGTKNET
ncbi:MAG: hypothetical protein ACFFG0_00705 [Candidatus Thorarchaeota archaeon]